MPADRAQGCWAVGEGWSGAPFESERLVYRRLDDRDVGALADLAADEEVARWTAFIPHPFDEQDARDYLARVREENRLVLAIERRVDGRFLGCIRIDRDPSAPADLGYWIGRPYWGEGYATEAVLRVLRLAFRDLGLAAVDGEVMSENLASARVLERAGFTFVGEEIGTRGRCDGVWTTRYRLTSGDWHRREAAKPVVLVVAVAMVDPDGRVLIAKRPEGKKMAGLWEFPGGKVADGETPETALIRELYEELGVDTRESCLAPFTFASHDYADFRLLMPLYVCRVWKGTPRAREGQELAWVRPQRMGDYPMPPADVPLVAMLCDLI